MAQRIRRSIRELENEYNAGNTKPLDMVIRAWKGIQELVPPLSPSFNPAPLDYSFFTIAGYHGEPFRGAGWGNSQWWGGFCNHGNVLFPTWHRAYLLRLEEAMRSIPDCQDVTLPFWDETAPESLKDGVPEIFLKKQVPLDGVIIDNPLYSYKFQKDIFDNLSPFPDADYSKPLGYNTVRYPFSGLVGPTDVAATTAHNNQFNAMGEAVVNGMLNDNVKDWLNYKIVIDETGADFFTGTHEKYVRCLDAPNYTVFSNTTSAAQWNEDHFGVRKWDPANPTKPQPAVVALESPHNDIHLSVGGFEVPAAGPSRDQIHGANGDMGENDTASFDPIFYFHHANVDRMFWLWQQKHGQTQPGSVDIIAGYPGTNTVDNQGPTPGVAANTWLTMESPLAPFEKSPGITYTSNDVIDIEGQLGYTYGPGSLSDTTTTIPASEPQLSLGKPVPPKSTASAPAHPLALRVTGVSRAAISGSFMLATWARVGDGTPQIIDVKAVLSRWHTQGCANCQNHLSVKTFVPLHMLTPDQIKKATFGVSVHTRKGLLENPPDKKAPAGTTPHFQLGTILKHG